MTTSKVNFEQMQLDYADYCMYNLEYLNAAIYDIEQTAEMIDKCSKDIKLRRKVYETLNDTHGLIVTYPESIRFDEGYIDPETEDEEQLLQDAELFEDYCHFNLILRIKALILYLNHCLKWLERVAKPDGWKYADNEIKDLIDDRRALINIFYKYNPEEYLKFIQIEDETKLFDHWDPLDGYKLPQRYTTFIPYLKDINEYHKTTSKPKVTN